MTSSWPDPLRAAVQWDLAEALVGIDSDAAAAAARRAEDIVRELRARGFEVARPRSPESPAETVPSGGAPCDTIPRREDAHPLIPTSHLQDLQQVPALRSRFQGDLLAGGLGGDELDGWNLIFTELVNNAIEHGCRSPGDAVGVAWGVSEACVTLAVVEPGECKITERDFDSADADGFAENGRGAGLFLIRAFVDVIRVSPADGGTEIRITRMRAEPGAGGGGER
jgi:anti-sigma regulatory factor (Ser/Thr protein kinase)